MIFVFATRLFLYVFTALQQFVLDLLVQDLNVLLPHHSDDLVRYKEAKIPQVCKVSNLEASILSLFRILFQPAVIPKPMAERGTKRSIIRSVSKWPMSRISMKILWSIKIK